MKYLLLFLSSLVCLSGLNAQDQPKPEPKKELDELRLKLNDDGSHYLKFTFLNQVWLKGNQSNPGTQVVGQPANQTFDIGLRRLRMQFYGQLTDHVFFYFHFGQNNFNFLSQNAGNRKLQPFFHDALGEYKVWKGNNHLILGGGLTITTGLSRFSQPSIGTIMSLDVPVFAQATTDQIDEFSRKLSVYARGQLGKFDYRLIMADPFPIYTNGTVVQGTPPTVNATFAQVGHHKQYAGFFMWNFFDKEQNVTPYMTGTYLGKKKVLNLEAGFITQKNAMWTGDAITSNFHDMNLWSVAVFYDAPLNTEKGTALNAYLGYFGTNYGPGYLRYNNALNPASSLATTTPPNPPYPAGSQGNAFPMFGTGHQIYAQFGYLLKKDLFGEGNGTLMPYVTVQSAKFDRLDKQMNVVDIGTNWLIKGHTSKISLDYQNRPVYLTQGNDLTRSGRRGQVTMQYQFYF